MRPKGTIYQSGKSGTHGEVILILPVIVKLTYNLLRGVGAGLIAFAVLAFSFSYGPILKQEVKFSLNNSIGEQVETTSETANLVDVAEADKIIEVQNEAKLKGVNSYFSVVIPKIEAASVVLANVDAGDKEEYLEALMHGVAHAKGTYFPGQNGRVFLFSHSTDSPLNFARYNAVFYLLRKLEPGDEIIVYFADKKYVYEVKEIVNAEADDSSWLEPKVGNEELVLMTCDPPGTTWRRLLIIAEPR